MPEEAGAGWLEEPEPLVEESGEPLGCAASGRFFASGALEPDCGEAGWSDAPLCCAAGECAELVPGAAVAGLDEVEEAESGAEEAA